MPLLDCDGLPCIDVTLANGKSVRMAIDTGDPESVMDVAVAKAAGLELQPLKAPDGGSSPGFKDVPLHGVPSWGELTVTIDDLSDYKRRGVFPKVDGTLGLSAFADRLIQLDFAHKTFRASAPLSASVPCHEPCGTLASITFGKRGPPILVATKGFELNGKPVSVQIDSMYAGAMLIYDASIEKLGLTELSKTSKTEHFPFTDEGVDMRAARAKEEGFGKRVLSKNAPLFFALPKVHQPDALFDGTVGVGLLGKSVVTLDFHDHQVWLN